MSKLDKLIEILFGIGIIILIYGGIMMIGAVVYTAFNHPELLKDNCCICRSVEK